MYYLSQLMGSLVCEFFKVAIFNNRSVQCWPLKHTCCHCIQLRSLSPVLNNWWALKLGIPSVHQHALNTAFHTPLWSSFLLHISHKNRISENTMDVGNTDSSTRCWISFKTIYILFSCDISIRGSDSLINSPLRLMGLSAICCCFYVCVGCALPASV